MTFYLPLVTIGFALLCPTLLVLVPTAYIAYCSTQTDYAKPDLRAHGRMGLKSKATEDKIKYGMPKGNEGQKGRGGLIQICKTQGCKKP